MERFAARKVFEKSVFKTTLKYFLIFSIMHRTNFLKKSSEWAAGIFKLTSSAVNLAIKTKMSPNVSTTILRSNLQILLPTGTLHVWGERTSAKPNKKKI